MADLWSDYTDVIIKEIDKNLGDNYKMSIGELLANVPKYATQPNMRMTVENMREESGKYIDGLLEEMPAQTKALDDSMTKVNEMTRQLSQNISMQARQHNVPLVKPFDVTRNADSEEGIQIDTIDDQVLKLVEKLTDGAVMVADFTTNYKNFNMGAWLFSRSGKNYVLSVYVPPNDAFDLELSRQELNDLFNAASKFASG